MGCGASRLDPNHEGVPPRLRPILRQRLDEMRARRGYSNYAPKPAPIDNDSVSPSRKSMSDYDSNSKHRHDLNDHYHRAQECPKSAQINKDHGDDGDANSRQVMPKSQGGENKGNGGRMGRKSEEAIKGSFEDHHEDDEEDGRRCLEYDSSPSFRFYCSSNEDIPAFSGVDDHFDGFTDSEENSGAQSISTNEESVSSNSNEASIQSLNKKGKTGRRLKQMMAKGGKHRFHKHSSYHNIIRRSPDNPHVLQRAVA